MKKSIYLLSLPLVAVSVLAFTNPQGSLGSSDTLLTESSPVSNPENMPEASERSKAQLIRPVAATDATQASPKREYVSAQAQGSLLDYNNVKKIREGETTLAEVEKLFGKPSEKELTDKHENWHYKINGWLRIQFDKAGKVTSYAYRLDDQETVPVLDVNDVRRIQVNTSDEAAILSTFGKPTSVEISPTTIRFFYQVPETNTSLSVQLRRLEKTLVSSYNYSTQHHNPVRIDENQVRGLEKNKSTAADIVQSFGEPNLKIVSATGEDWTYKTENTSLLLRFKMWEETKGVILENYLYKTDS
ncbi:hypothetical protein [Pontibacter beigongshangensis]|uniref:hypothetical protein n=1 Tax=Pontibacter beigongshangensis TaxID=2574733 RepID=UPI0016507F56|nr:hypothetical protein [Pontibacter beigongshangensis]